MRKTNSFCLILAVLTLFLACNSSQKLLEKGRYDDAIKKAADKLRKNPDDSDELYVLKEAYKQANLFDLSRIDFLEKEDRQENWLEIYFLYTGLDRRQDIIRSLPTAVRNEFTLVNYNEEIIESKKTAAEATYEQGVNYLERGDRRNARLAHAKFLEVQDIYYDYKNVNQLLQEARYLGTNFILLRVENNSDKVLPDEFDNELKKIGLGDLNTEWLQYEAIADSTLHYDYHVVINIQNIDVSPETIEKQTYTETAEIQDGMTYEFDENGNVKKDSLGNDIRVPNYVTVSAEITESVQHKSAVISGSIDYIDLHNNRLVKTENISVNGVFEHFSAAVSGDERALSDETLKKSNSRPVPFPSDEMMLMDAAELLKSKSKAIIYQNSSLLENEGI